MCATASKPVHRRILYAMNESGYLPTRPHMKSARTVGDVIGKYHPHGDTAVYDTIVQPCAAVQHARPAGRRPRQLRLPRTSGDSAAAMRYAEARLDEPAMELLRDLDKETVDFRPRLRRESLPGTRGPAPAASPTCWSTAPTASPWAWPPTSRRTTWARPSTQPAP